MLDRIETRGRKPTWNDMKQLRQAVDDYFDRCDETEAFPDEAGMRLWLKINKADVERMCDPKKNPANFQRCREIFEYAKDRRESWLSRKAIDNKAATGCFNLLKQPQNGGYTDKPQENNARELTIVVGGGGTVELFK